MAYTMPFFMKELFNCFDRADIRILLKSESKEPIVNNWPKCKEKRNIEKLLELGLNYGLRTGKKIGRYYFCALDFDKKGNYSKFPFTSYVKTYQGRHVYLKIKELPPKCFLYYQGEKVGELQSKGQYVVGFGSIHPTGKKYEFIKRGKWFWKFESIEELKKKLKKYEIELR